MLNHDGLRNSNMPQPYSHMIVSIKVVGLHCWHSLDQATIAFSDGSAVCQCHIGPEETHLSCQ